MAEFLFKDRITATPNRIKLTKVADDTYDVEKIPGEVAEEGTPLNATTMNKLAQKDGTNTALMNTVFTEAATRANIASGETHATLFGKIRKFFTDLKAHAFNDLATALGTETDKAPTNKLLNDTAALKVDKTSISTVMPISSAAASNEKVLGEKVVYDEFAKTAENLNAMEKEINSKVTKELSINLHARKPLGGNWSVKNWTGLANFLGNRIWTDGTNIYYSNFADQYVLDVATSTWSAKTWMGLTNFDGRDIWTDGTNIYYSNFADQYVLNVATSTWSAKTWMGLTSFNGDYIWTDGTNIYYSSDTNQYVLNVATSTWSAKTWTGLTGFFGNLIWTDDTNIYYSYDGSQYVLDVSTSTWSIKTWTGLTSFFGTGIWTDGTNIYYSYDGSQYVLDVSTSTWSIKTWTGLTSFFGTGIWTDGTNIYYSYDGSQYVLIPKKSIRGNFQ